MLNRIRFWRAATPFVFVAYLAAVLGGAQGFVVCWEAAGHTAIEATDSASQIHHVEEEAGARLAADAGFTLRPGHEFVCIDAPAILEMGRTDLAFVQGTDGEGPTTFDDALDHYLRDSSTQIARRADQRPEVVNVANFDSLGSVVLLI